MYSTRVDRAGVAAIADLRRTRGRRIAIRGHTFPEVAERPLFQELLERHIWRNVSA